MSASISSGRADGFRTVRMLALARKELRQIRRDTRSLVLAFLVPVQMLLLFGYAVSWDVRDIALAVADEDRTAASRALVDAFAAAGTSTCSLRRRATSSRTRCCAAAPPRPSW